MSYQKGLFGWYVAETMERISKSNFKKPEVLAGLEKHFYEVLS